MNNQLVQDLKNLGIKKGDKILMHSSIKGLKLSITPKEIIDSLLEVLGETGTLVLPAFSYMNVNDENPIFDVLNSPVEAIGYLPEYFRTHYNCIRSLHPTHSLCAIGKDAVELTNTHHKDTTPVGINSPINKLIASGGKILMLGCSLLTSTFMHGIEEKLKIHYCLKNDPVKRYIIDYNKNKFDVVYYPHNLNNIEQCYDRLELVLTDECMKKDKLLNGTGILITNTKKAVEIARMYYTADEMYFVEKHN